jgi:hypothetical protein
MTKSNIVIAIYIFGLIIGALGLGLWDANSGPRALLGLAWTVIFLISLFYAEQK